MVTKHCALLFLVITCLVSLINAGACVNFSTSYAPRTGPVCSPFLAESVYVPVAFLPALSIIDEQFNATVLVNLTAVQPIAQIGCYNQLISLLCNTAFQPCASVWVPELNSTVDLPIPACNSVCEKVNEECATFWSFIGSAPLNCSMLSEVTNQIAWPEEYYETNVEGVNVQSQCFPYSDLLISTVPWNGTCPYPMIKLTHPEETNARCEIPCPDPMYTRKEWKKLAKMEVICASIATFFVGFLCVYYLLNPNCRKRKKIVELYGFLNLMMFEISFLVGGSDPVDNMWCIGESKFATFSRPSCGAQGVLFSYFALTTSFWLTVSAINVYYLLTDNKYKFTRKTELLYCAFAFGIPFIFVLIPTAMGEIQYYWHTGVCFIQHYPPGNGKLNFHFFFFYMPLGASILATFVFTVLTLAKLFAHTRSMERILSSSNRNSATVKRDDSTLKLINFRLLAWCAVESVVLLITIVYRAQLGSKSTTETWIDCKVMSQLGLGLDTACPQSHLPISVSFGETMVHYGIVSSSGTLAFLATGTNKNIYVFFGDLFLCLYRRQWRQFINLITLDSKQLERLAPSNVPTTASLTSRRTDPSPTSSRRTDHSPSHSPVHSRRSSTSPTNSAFVDLNEFHPEPPLSPLVPQESLTLYTEYSPQEEGEREREEDSLPPSIPPNNNNNNNNDSPSISTPSFTASRSIVDPPFIQLDGSSTHLTSPDAQ